MQNELVHTQYHIRISNKARYLQLRMRPLGLEVVVPKKARLSQADIEQFVFEKKNWIEKHLSFLSKPAPLAPPHAITLSGLNEVVEISYQTTDATRLQLIMVSATQLLIKGSTVSNTIQCVTLLKRWLKLKAFDFLEKRLTQLANDVQLPFRTLTIRDMTSRWGSCSSEKKINLCTNLIFLPSHLIDHVILHELCHTKYMSHGKRFWSLLERLDANAKNHVRELKRASKFIPSWLLS